MHLPGSAALRDRYATLLRGLRAAAGGVLTVGLAVGASSPTRAGDRAWRDLSDPGASLSISGGRTDRAKHEIRLPAFRFDPVTTGEPELPLFGPGADLGSGLFLVQLERPPRDAIYAQLVETGAEVIQYYPHDTYLVWSDAESRHRLEDLGVVRWVGPMQPDYKIGRGLIGRTGPLERWVAWIYDDGRLESLLADLRVRGADEIAVAKANGSGSLKTLEGRGSEVDLGFLARQPSVIWLGPGSAGRVADDESSDQIVAGNHPSGVPFPGYEAHLAALGVDGTGVVWAVSDTGVDWDHPDLASHIVGGFTPPLANCDIPGQPGSDCAGGGHGTHVAGILAGDATAGFTDGDGFLYGLGVAPATGIFALNVFADISLEDMTMRAILGGAIGSNNSWATSANSEGSGYTLAARTQDVLVRDGNLDTPDVAEPFIQVFSAGSSGPNPSTITEPKEAKNIISVGSSLSARGGDIDQIGPGSSRGPAIDGRTLPVVAAPGFEISSTRNDLGGQCAVPIPGTDDLYAFCTGSSMAAPHVAGAVVLATEWWRTRNQGADPSMAMAKALVITSSFDMGTPDIPNNDEGWGRVNWTRIVAPGVPVVYLDQSVLLTDTGLGWSATYSRAVADQPLKVSLVYSDAPGAPDANPALVNDLDLEVELSGQVYLGNVFAAGWSIPGGAADHLNNVEAVYLPTAGAGLVEVRILATLIAGDGVPYNGDPTDQDFALICWNCENVLFADGFESGDTAAWSLP